jgi:hypothetical protein
MIAATMYSRDSFSIYAANRLMPKKWHLAGIDAAQAQELRISV